jgi:hypothetical protein
MQAIVIGLGAALLMTGAARAQEIENTNFDDGPNVTKFAQPQHSDFVVAPATAATPAAATSTSATDVPVTTREAALSVLAPIEGWMIAFLLLCIALIATYAVSELRAISQLRQARRNLNARMRSHLDRRVALS